MATLGSLLLTALAFLGVATLSHNRQDAQEQARAQYKVRPERPRHLQLRPFHDSDLVLPTASMTTDGRGGRRFVLSGGRLQKGKLTKLFWAIDSRSSTYAVYELGEDAAKDARRIAAFLSIFRKGIDEGVLTNKIAAVVALGERKRESLRSRAASFPARLDEPAQTLGGPSEAENVFEQYCKGSGWATVMTWEPARYLFNVNHLAETHNHANWLRYPATGRMDPFEVDGYCWSNPDTFANTSWATLACTKTFDKGVSYLNSATVGHYRNDDFLSDAHYVEVVNEASVAYSNGYPHWGAMYQDVNFGDWNGYEDIFLSGWKLGDAWEEPCVGSDDPAPAPGDPNGSPIILDVSRDGYDLTSFADGVRFDLNGDGTPEQVSWTQLGSDDSFLAFDRNQNGRIDNGSELFGNYTPPFLGNGFEVLKVADYDNNGVIDQGDPIFAKLLVWTDRNHNGISEPSELQTAEATGLLGLHLDYKEANKKDKHGNLFRQRARVVWPSKDDFGYDVWLRLR